jgi:hypothetical protein
MPKFKDNSHLETNSAKSKSGYKKAQSKRVIKTSKRKISTFHNAKKRNSIESGIEKMSKNRHLLELHKARNDADQTVEMIRSRNLDRELTTDLEK